MTARPVVPTRGGISVGLGPRVALIALLVCLAALVPRLVSLGTFATIDEVAHWVERTQRFSDAVADGRFAAAHQTGHPGVTLMWLGSIGLALERAARALGWPMPDSPLAQLAWMRAPAAVLQALLVPVGYLLLRRLIDRRAALLAALLWATSPYLVAHGRLLHLDGLLSWFVTLSVLMLLAALAPLHQAGAAVPGRQAARAGHLVHPALYIGSGVFGGLAILTKAPALILLPFVGAALLMHARVPWPARLRATALMFLLWLGVAALTVFLLHPALWADPARVLHSYREEIVDNGGRPNGAGQFFLGRAVDDPGPLFYPVASALRTTPLMLVGLVLYCGLRIVDGRSRLPVRRSQYVEHPRQQDGTSFWLVAFVLLWFAVMTLGPKKFDRYVLPAWPALEVLAALGLIHAVDRATRSLRPRPSSLLPRPSSLVIGGVAMVQFGTLALSHPYELSYYNPLLGGGALAQRTLLIGWGEGMDQVGAYLEARPDIGYGPVLSALEPTLQPFVSVPVTSVDDLGRGSQNYAVVYLESLQRGANQAAYDAIRSTVPLTTISIHDIDYATIYQLPRPFARALPARFGDALHLWGVTVERTPEQVVVTPAWDVRGPLDADYTLFLHLYDARGARVAQIDLPPGGAETPPTSQWQPGQQVAVPLPLPLPPALPPGDYILALGLYDAAGARLPLAATTPADPTLAGPDALLVERLRIEASP